MKKTTLKEFLKNNWTYLFLVVSVAAVLISVLLASKVNDKIFAVISGFGISLFCGWLIFYFVEFLPSRTRSKAAYITAKPYLEKLYTSLSEIIECVLFYGEIVSNGNYAAIDYAKVEHVMRMSTKYYIRQNRIINGKAIDVICRDIVGDEYIKNINVKKIVDSLDKIILFLPVELITILSELSNIEIQKAIIHHDLIHSDYMEKSRNGVLLEKFKVLVDNYLLLEKYKFKKVRYIFEIDSRTEDERNKQIATALINLTKQN